VGKVDGLSDFVLLGCFIGSYHHMFELDISACRRSDEKECNNALFVVT